MNRTTLSALALSLLLPLAACGQSGQADPQSDGANSGASTAADASEKAPLSELISGEMQKAMQEAKQKLASSNINVTNLQAGNSQHHDNDARPKAEITPQGELLIGGKRVAATPAQHALLVEHRQQLVAIAEAGMDIGTQGADLGLQATRQALWGALAGRSEQDIEAAIKPQADRIKAAALNLCRRLPGLLASQQKLAAAMPEFRPYATMEQKDVDDCAREAADKDGKHGAAVFSD